MNAAPSPYKTLFAALVATLVAAWLVLSFAWNLFFLVLPGDAYYHQHLSNTYPAQSMLNQMSNTIMEDSPCLARCQKAWDKLRDLRDDPIFAEADFKRHLVYSRKFSLLIPYPFNNDNINTAAAPERMIRGIEADTTSDPVTRLFPAKQKETALMVALGAILISFGFVAYRMRQLSAAVARRPTRALYWSIFAAVNSITLLLVYLAMFFAGLYFKYGT